MSIIKCPECTREISNKAPVCPGCGFPISATAKANHHLINDKSKSPEKGNKGCLLVLLASFIGLFVFLWFVGQNQNSQPVYQPQTPKPQAFSQPIQSLPNTGDTTVQTNNGVAPLSIKTPVGGNHYLVKLINKATNAYFGSYFIRSGDILNTNVPIGTYELRYATGTQWYGLIYLFGPETRYFKADSLLTFNFDGRQYNGHTIELIMQLGGNLGTSGIDPSQW